MTFSNLLILLFAMSVPIAAHLRKEDVSRITGINFYYNNRFDGTNEIILSAETEQKWKIINCSRCYSFRNNKLECREGNNLIIEVEKKDVGYRLPIYMTCSNDSYINNTILYLTQKRGFTDITVYWDTQRYATEYDICFISNKEGLFTCKNVTTISNSNRFIHLEEKTEYYICIAIINRTENLWMSSGYKCGQIGTDFTHTGPIRHFHYSIYSNYISLYWYKPEFEFDYPEGYIVEYTDENDECNSIIIQRSDQMVNRSSCGTSPKIKRDCCTSYSIKIFDVFPFSRYKIEVIPVNGDKISIPTVANVTTSTHRSHAVNNLKVEYLKDSIRIRFDPPTYTQGTIVKYIIEIYLTKVNLCEEMKRTLVSSSSNSIETVHLISTQSWRCGLYLVRVTPVNDYNEANGRGYRKEIYYNYRTDVSSLNEKIDIRYMSNNLIKISLQNYSINKCESHGFVADIVVEGEEYLCKVLVTRWNWCYQINEIIKRKFECPNKEFVKFNTDYIHGQRVFEGPSKNYSNVIVNLWSINNEITFIKSVKLNHYKYIESKMYIYIIIVTLLVFFAMVAVLLIIKKKNLSICKRATDVKEVTVKDKNMTGGDYVKKLISPFKRNVPQNYEDSDEIIYSEEFQKLNIDAANIAAKRGFTTHVGQLLINLKKNRQSEFVPYDHSRVILRNKQSPNDYINASYVFFSRNKRKPEYIAAQDPIMQNIWDFWEMIWQENVNVVVMFSSVSKCSDLHCIQYWPDGVNKKFTFGHSNEIVVLLKRENDNTIFTEREILVENKKDNKSRSIIQLQMSTWSLQGEAKFEDYDKVMSRFQELIEAMRPPFLVHCRTGVSQTGEFISLNRLMKDLRDGCPEVNIYETVLTLRENRPFMVNVQQSYSFIHKYMKHHKNDLENL